jgi:hypothetical protein
MEPSEGPEDEWELVDRIIGLRAKGWTYEEIGARLQSEGFNPRHPSGWPVQILRRLAQRRSAADDSSLSGGETEATT